MKREEIHQVIRAAIEELNPQLPERRRVGGDLSSPLFGGEAPLDSLGLVELIVLVEEGLFSKTGSTVTLTDERAFSQKHSRFEQWKA